MEIEVKEVTDQKEKETISRGILRALPEWSGSPESAEEYITDSQGKPFLVCYADGRVVGYMVLNAASADCTDVFAMGVEKEPRYVGIGSKLNVTCEAMTKKLGYTYSQAKTVQVGHYKEYGITSRFYLAAGYKELERLSTLQDEWNPCQIYIKYLGK